MIKKMFLLTLVTIVLSLMTGCATPRKPMIWVPVNTASADNNFKQDIYQCQQDAGIFSGAYSQRGTSSDRITRSSTYKNRLSACMEAKGYSLEDKEMYESKIVSLNKLSDECPARVGINLSSADIAPPRILGLDKDGPAAKSGLEKGDIIKKINNTEINSSVQFMKHLFVTIKPGIPVEILIQRQGGFQKTFTVIPENKQ